MPIILDEQRFAAAVNKAAQTNSERQAEIITKSDGYCYQVAHPEFRQTEKNLRLVNQWLLAQGITNPTFPDFASAVEALSAEGLLAIDKTAKAPTTFYSPVTGRTYDSLDSFIAQERHAALNTKPVISDEQTDFDNMPFEEFQERIKDAVRGEQLKVNGLQTQKNADAWISLNKWYVDNTHNARLVKLQLAANGASDNNASIEQFDVATNQLRDAGLLTINQNAVAKENAADVAQLAADHKAREFNEADAEMLPLDEVRRRGEGNYSGR